MEINHFLLYTIITIGQHYNAKCTYTIGMCSYIYGTFHRFRLTDAAVQFALLESLQDGSGFTEAWNPGVQDIMVDTVRELAEHYHVFHAVRHLHRWTMAHRRNKTNNAVRGNNGQKDDAPNQAGCLL